jgi:hypothetical protein
MVSLLIGVVPASEQVWSPSLLSQNFQPMSAVSEASWAVIDIPIT